MRGRLVAPAPAVRADRSPGERGLPLPGAPTSDRPVTIARVTVTRANVTALSGVAPSVTIARSTRLRAAMPAAAVGIRMQLARQPSRRADS